MNSSLRALLVLAALHGTACIVDTTDDTPCDPNPCATANRTVCVEEAGEARCLCDRGFIARPNGACEPVGPSNCAEHAGDASEPDDCLLSARPLSEGSGGARQQTIEPIGDYDFFQFTATARGVYKLSVKADAPLMPRVDVFDQGGLWLSSAEAPGQVELYFRARTSAPYFARLSHSPQDPSVAVGGYTLSLTPRGEDFHGNFAEDATPATDPYTSNPDPNYGRFEYPYDEDWFSFSGTQGRSYSLSFDPSLMLPVVAVYDGSNLRQPLFTDRNAELSFSVPASRTFFIVLYAPQGEEGSYAFKLFAN
ncbi:MAG: hypothetical protein JXB05_25040 [Myxococcaceae bacterium]|nr:hypothetical protein [Myxococcaceae bacterium]